MKGAAGWGEEEEEDEHVGAEEVGEEEQKGRGGGGGRSRRRMRRRSASKQLGGFIGKPSVLYSSDLEPYSETKRLSRIPGIIFGIFAVSCATETVQPSLIPAGLVIAMKAPDSATFSASHLSGNQAGIGGEYISVTQPPTCDVQQPVVLTIDYKL